MCVHGLDPGSEFVWLVHVPSCYVLLVVSRLYHACRLIFVGQICHLFRDHMLQEVKCVSFIVNYNCLLTRQCIGKFQSNIKS